MWCVAVGTRCRQDVERHSGGSAAQERSGGSPVMRALGGGWRRSKSGALVGRGSSFPLPPPQGANTRKETHTLVIHVMLHNALYVGSRAPRRSDILAMTTASANFFHSRAVDGDAVERHHVVLTTRVQRPKHFGFDDHEGERHRRGVRRKDERLQRPRLIACNAAASGCESKVECVLGVTIGRGWGSLRWTKLTTTTCTLPLATCQRYWHWHLGLAPSPK